jgi:Phage integrase SAM-like domain
MDSSQRHHDGRFARAGEAVSAEAALEAKQGELAARETVSPKGGTVKLHPLFEAYLAHLERKGRDPKTVTRNRASFVRLACWLAEAGTDAGAATELLVEEYVAWLANNLAETTANRETAHAKAAYRYAVRTGMIDSNPADGIEASLEPIPVGVPSWRRAR